MRSKAVMMPLESGSASTRPSIRDAVNATIEGCEVDDRAFCAKARMSFAALSEFREGARDLTTKTLDQAIEALTTPEFLFFLTALEGAEASGRQKLRLSEDGLLQHPAFSPLMSHIIKHCGTLHFHELLCLITDCRRLDPTDVTEALCCSTTLPAIDFWSARLSVREALSATLDAFAIQGTELAQKSKVPAPAISSYRTHRRELTTKTMGQILQTFTTEQYLYFVGIFRGAIELLQEADPTFPQHPDDPEHQYRAFRTLLSRIATNCTIDQFDELFCMMADSRRTAKNVAQYIIKEETKSF